MSTPPLSLKIFAYDGFTNLEVLALHFVSFSLVVWRSLHSGDLSWEEFGSNMHHGLRDFLSLHLCNMGCIGNQLLLTNLFDEFDFVQISFRIPARATGLLIASTFGSTNLEVPHPHFVFSLGDW